MHRKSIIISLLMVAGIVVLIAGSAVAAYALAGDSLTQPEEVQVETIAPSLAEPVKNVQTVRSVKDDNLLGSASYGAGCPYSHEAKQQLTKAPSESLEDQTLAQLEQ